RQSHADRRRRGDGGLWHHAHPRTQPDPHPRRVRPHRQRPQHPVPGRLRTRRGGPDPGTVRGADGRSAAAGDGAHRDRHHARHDRLRARARLPRVAADRHRRRPGRPRGRSDPSPRRARPGVGDLRRGGRHRAARRGLRGRRGRHDAGGAGLMEHLLDQLVLAPVLLPLLGAGLCLAFGRFAAAQRLISILTLVTVLAAATVLLIRSDSHGPQAFNVGGWPAELGISLVADRLSSLLLLISTIVTLCVLLYSIGQGIVEYGRDSPLAVFYPPFLVLSAGVSNAFLSADLFNLFVGFEILLAASYVLITLGGTEARVRSGTIYIIVSLASSALFLIAVASVYAATGTVNFAQLAQRIPERTDPVGTLLQIMLLLTFAAKAAVFPLSAWLPGSSPTPPAPVTAVFAGLLTKVGVYAMLR